MKRFSHFLFVLLAAAPLFAANLNIVVQSFSGERVAGVQVSLFRAAGHAGVGILNTTGDGTVEFTGLGDGEYQAEILAPGFAPQTVKARAICAGFDRYALRFMRGSCTRLRWCRRGSFRLR